MKLYKKIAISVVCLGLLTASVVTGASISEETIGVINFKVLAEQSKLGKQELKSFEDLKRQVVSALEKKEKEATETVAQLDDSDFVDGLSQQALEELKKKFQAQGQELAAYQQQYTQMLQQAHVKILQGISERVGKAAERIAKERGFSLILNEETTFFYTSKQDLTSSVLVQMDRDFDEEQAGDTTAIPAFQGVQKTSAQS
ncbi:OmpH family outer membrane protein [Simkania negevensis]|uniref:OmpH family outer membrane protein n=1 Tax=Simkania negevensis TaxID=83561 RepID=A0ABS3AUS4_9BACT|nr:OmpH family outer membrane protein [Simkania negevensis]